MESRPIPKALGMAEMELMRHCPEGECPLVVAPSSLDVPYLT